MPLSFRFHFSHVEIAGFMTWNLFYYYERSFF